MTEIKKMKLFYNLKNRIEFLNYLNFQFKILKTSLIFKNYLYNY